MSEKRGKTKISLHNIHKIIKNAILIKVSIFLISNTYISMSNEQRIIIYILKL